MHRTRVRVLRVAGAVAAWLVVLSCNAISHYVPDQRLTTKNGALLRVAKQEAGLFSGGTALDIFTLDKECPNLSYRLASQGYQGSAMIDGQGTSRILIPADQAILLRLSWTQVTPWYTSQCNAAVIVRPERGSEYDVRFVSPAQGGNRCSIGLAELVESDDGELEPEPVRSLVDLDMGSRWDAISPEAVCAAGRRLR